MKLLNEAYEVLCDPELRSVYNAQRAEEAARRAREEQARREQEARRRQEEQRRQQAEREAQARRAEEERRRQEEARQRQEEAARAEVERQRQEEAQREEEARRRQQEEQEERERQRQRAMPLPIPERRAAVLALLRWEAFGLGGLYLLNGMTTGVGAYLQTLHAPTLLDLVVNLLWLALYLVLGLGLLVVWLGCIIASFCNLFFLGSALAGKMSAAEVDNIYAPLWADCKQWLHTSAQKGIRYLREICK